MRLSLLRRGEELHQEGLWALSWVPNTEHLVTGNDLKGCSHVCSGICIV